MKFLLPLLAVGIILAGCDAAPGGPDGPSSSAADSASSQEVERVALTGESVCLPHRDTSGPQTMECAFGIRTDTGEYYALDFTLLSSDAGGSNFRTGERTTVEGVLMPRTSISSATWQRYDIVGMIAVTSVTRE